MKLTAAQFRGEVPRLSPELLPDNAAQAAINTRLVNGNLEAWQHFALTATLANGSPVQTIYRLNGQWLSWSAQVDVARGHIPGDTEFYAFLTSPGLYSEPRFTTFSLATAGAPPFPVDTRPLGVPAPTANPTFEVGVDPTPTSFSVDVSDAGDALETSWTSSGNRPGFDFGSVVQQHPTIGNPAPSYSIGIENNFGDPAYLYRDFGIRRASAVLFECDFAVTSNPSDDGFIAEAAIQVDEGGAGLTIAVAGGYATPVLIALRQTVWGSRSELRRVPLTEGLTRLAWRRLEVTKTINEDGSATVRARVLNGTTQIALLTISAEFTSGDFCGFLGVTGDDVKEAYFDNIRVRASGSTGYAPLNTATAYVYTFKNDLGWESAPSFPTETLLRPPGVAVTVTTPTAAPSGYSITTKAIYRLVTGLTGTAYRLVAEIPLAQADYIDAANDNQLPDDVLESEEWDLPPATLQGILALPNGIMAGFFRNQLCLTPKGQPHAWPVRWRLTTDTDIVAIGNIDTTVVVATRNFIYLASGTEPESYAMSKLEYPQACVSKLSLTYLIDMGVAFASPDGVFAVAGNGRGEIITREVFTREQWQALNPASMWAISHDDIYFMFFTRLDGSKGGYAIDMKGSGFGIVQLSFYARCGHVDPLTDTLYLVLESYTGAGGVPSEDTFTVAAGGVTIYAFNANPSTKMPYRWRGKLYELPSPAHLPFAKIERGAGTEPVRGRVIADGVQVSEQAADVPVYRVAPRGGSGNPQPSKEWVLELAGTRRVRSMHLASTAGELNT